MELDCFFEVWLFLLLVGALPFELASAFFDALRFFVPFTVTLTSFFTSMAGFSFGSSMVGLRTKLYPRSIFSSVADRGSASTISMGVFGK